jgi:hypothetical protein
MARWSFKVVRSAPGVLPAVHVTLKPPMPLALADRQSARPASCPPSAAVAYVNLAKGSGKSDHRLTPMARFSTVQLRGGPIRSSAAWAGAQSRYGHAQFA